MPNGINNYIFHATDFDIMANSTESFAYAYIPGMFIFGLTEPHDPREWKDLRIGFSGGVYVHRNRVMPGFVQTLIAEKLALSSTAKASISPAQRQKIAEAMPKDPEELLNFPLARSYLADYLLERGRG